MPLAGKVSPGSPPDAAGIFLAELGGPFGGCLERNCDATLSQQIFYMTQAQGKAEIEPNRMRYDLGRKTKALRVGLEKVSTILVPCEPSGDQADVGDHDPCLG